MKRTVIGLIIFVVVVTVISATTLHTHYSGGEYYVDLSTAPLLPESALETVVSYPEPIGNIAVASDGRIFFTVHPESRPELIKLLVSKDGKSEPFPDLESQESLYQTPLGVVVDQQDRLWVIDHGFHGLGSPRLLAFDIHSGEVVHDHLFAPDIGELGSFLQDLQVSPDGKTVYIADVSFIRKNPGLVVYDIASETARRVLESHSSVYPQEWIIRSPIKDMVFLGGLIALKPGVDGIAVSRDGKWIYYGAMAHDGLFRISTDDLKNAQLTPDQLAAGVERVGDKPLNDGLSADDDGNVLITDVEHNSVVKMSPSGELKTLIRSEQIRWPDALSFGPAGYLYVADSAIPEQMLQSKGHIKRRGPYNIFRFKPETSGTAGQ